MKGNNSHKLLPEAISSENLAKSREVHERYHPVVVQRRWSAESAGPERELL